MRKRRPIERIFSVLLALTMMLGLGLTAFAAETYTITVTNDPSTTNVSIVGKTFNAYKIFDVSYADTDNDSKNEAFSYTISNQSSWWSAVLTYMGGGETSATADGDGVYTGRGLKLIPMLNNSAKYTVEVTTLAEGTAKVEGVTYFDAREFADFLRGKIATSMSADGTGTGAKDSTGNGESASINVSTAGYYLVTGSGTAESSNDVVAAAALYTTQPTATIALKAEAPALDKDIVTGTDDNGEETTKKGTSAEVGETVTFKLTSNVPDTTGYSNYTFLITDTLSKGLTLNVDSTNEKAPFTVKVGTQEVTLTKAESAENLTSDAYFITNNADGTTTFKISLAMLNTDGSAKYTSTTGASIPITVEYSATVNENALSTDVETNTATLTYSNNPYESNSKAMTPDKKVYVYDFDIIVDKYTGDKTDGARLAGAKFVLYKKVTENGKETKQYYKYTEADTNTGAAADVSWVTDIKDATVVETDKNGAAKFQGLEAGTYYLSETEPPAGYNALTKDVMVEIKAEYNEDGTIKTDEGSNTTVSSTNNGQYSITSKVMNQAGTLLPSTGGIGTTIFYVIGGLLVAGAAILLIAKKRMSGRDIT